jgi:hypothetical protein
MSSDHRKIRAADVMSGMDRLHGVLIAWGNEIIASKPGAARWWWEFASRSEVQPICCRPNKTVNSPPVPLALN